MSQQRRVVPDALMWDVKKAPWVECPRRLFLFDASLDSAAGRNPKGSRLPSRARCQWMMIDTVEYAGTVIVSLYVPAFVPRATGNWPKPCSVAGTDVGIVRWLL